ncbi:MAG TPA: DNA-binding domain-containing protein [Candidatus Acidoferrum sp.]|nr:DNA-binding domain-containing protein [Candidatus Acidoferrum sp.]
MRLASLQKAVARAVMQPLTRNERTGALGPGGESMSRYAARYIKPNDRLTSFERLEIYNRQYWFRVFGAMAEDFPGLRAILGERRFDDMCRAYLMECPSQSFTLRNLGARLEAWLRRNPSWLRGKKVLAFDMVRLEWADIEAFDGKAEPVLRVEDLHGVSASKLRLRVQPYVQLLELHYPVDDLVLEVRKDDQGADFASNAIAERRKHVRVRAVGALQPKEIFLVVHRIDYSVYFRRLKHEEYTLLRILRAGKSIGQAIGLAFRGSSLPESNRGGYVQRCFETWAALGWFCQPSVGSTGNLKIEKGKV